MSDPTNNELAWFIDQPHQLPNHREIHEAYVQLSTLLRPLPQTFSKTSAIRKLLESRDACVRACSQRLIQPVGKPIERTTFAASFSEPEHVALSKIVTPAKRRSKKR